MADKRKPWMKWYTRDWRSNAKLRMCSYAARGLWADIISLMAEAEHFGFLMINGIVPTCKQLAGLLGGTEREVAKLRDELGDANVYSVTGSDMPEDVRALIPAGIPDGVVFSRRMVRDAAKAIQDRENGKGGGNPKLREPHKEGVNPQSNPQRSEIRNQSSEAKASGVPPDVAKTVFDEGVALLVKTGTAPNQARGIVGKWRSKAKDDQRVAGLIREAVRRDISQPVEWFTKALARPAENDPWAGVDV